MIVFPKAKINLGLRITGKRPDGYHDIETLFYPITLCDALEFIVPDNPLKKDILTITGIDTVDNVEDNLVIKAVRKLREKHSFPLLKIHLHKVIPTGAGLGGGSSDAAFLLKAINRCFELSINNSNLNTMALELGSDCPFFIDPVPSFATGRGEILEPIKPVLTGYYIVLLNPGIGINTHEVYQNCKPGDTLTNLLQLIDHPISTWRELIINDFENFVFNRYPIISDIKNELYNSGSLFSLMSGSGSSVYGIFPDKPGLSDKLLRYVIYEGLI